MSLISASLLVSVFTIVQAQSPAAPAAKATNWSDPATWPNRRLPVAGDKVIIDAGKEVVLDVNTPPLNGVTAGFLDGRNEHLFYVTSISFRIPDKSTLKRWNSNSSFVNRYQNVPSD